MKAILQALMFTLVFVTGSASASTVQKLSFERLAKESDVIVAGRVEEVSPDQAPDKSFAKTRITIAVAEQFKGKTVASLVIEQATGTIGNVTQGAPGTTEFAAGEQVILFLRRGSHDSYRIVGGRQGKFTVKTEPSGDRKVVEDFAHRIEPYDQFVARLSQAGKAPK